MEAVVKFEDYHCEPDQMVSGFRYEQPSKATHNPNWKYECMTQQNPIHSMKAPCDMFFGEMSSAMQGSCRQGRITEMMQWGLEMIRTRGSIDYPELVASGKHRREKPGMGENNLWKRCIIICAEDVSFGNSNLIVAAAQLLDVQLTFKTQQEAELEAMNFMKYLGASLKSRVCDYGCISRVQIPERERGHPQNGQPFNNNYYATKLYECLTKTEMAPFTLGYMDAFIFQSLTDKEEKNTNPFPLADFKSYTANITGIKHYKNRRVIIWIVLYRVLKELNDKAIKENDPHRWWTVTKVVESCYKISMHSGQVKFRWEKEGRLFGRMAILAILYKEQVEARGLNYEIDKPIEINGVMTSTTDPAYYWTMQQMEEFRCRTRDGDLIFQFPDNCFDQHTKTGKSMGRRAQHFLEVKSRLSHEYESFKPLSDFYLQLCYVTRYNREDWAQGTLRTVHEHMQDPSKESYLQVLRTQHDKSGAFDNKIRALTNAIIKNPTLANNYTLKVSKERVIQLLEYCKSINMIPIGNLVPQLLAKMDKHDGENALTQLKAFFGDVTGPVTLHYCLWEDVMGVIDGTPRHYGDVWF
tara:strand:+ start:145523 stop:147268 length:1746 start_codon:yes stop_codon:yes gene_type:complete